MNIIVCGVGGTGVLLFSKILSSFYKKKNKISVSEKKGHAKRGGSVSVNLRINEGDDFVVPRGHADFIIAFEPLEALRMKSLVKNNGVEDTGVILVNPEPIFPVPVLTGDQKYPLVEDILKALGENCIVVKAAEVIKKLGNKKLLNTIMLGFFTALNNLPKGEILRLIKKFLPERYLEINQTAFEEGWRLGESEKQRSRHSFN